MKKLFTVPLRATKNSLRGNMNHCRVFSIYSILTIVAIMLMVPLGMRAEIVTTTYDFKASVDANSTNVNSSSTTVEGYSNCNYFTELGNVSGNPGRLAAQGANNFTLFRHGLYNQNTGGRRFVVDNLYAGDVVEFSGMVANTGGNTDVGLESTNATKDGNTFTMSEKGKLVVSIAKTTWIGKITIQHDDAASFGYDPAVEIYDLYNESGSYGTTDADFQLNGRTAKYLTTLQSGMALNNRIAISTTSDNGTYNWVFEDHGLRAKYSWHNLSICNLVEGDRVVITYTGQATFSSVGQNGGYNGCAAFKDVENNGDFIEGQDAYIYNGMAVENKTTDYDWNVRENKYTTFAYTVTEDGHLDIGLAADSRIFKIQIYGDHQARMVDKDNTLNTKTSYFDTTGQLETKHHIVPGGLHVYVGNDDDTQHAEVVRSDVGPVSFVYDQQHFKMARQSGNGMNATSAPPASGTYYRFKPEVKGKMWVKFKAANINYRNYDVAGNGVIDQYGTPNERTTNVNCQYYLMVEEPNGQYRTVASKTYANGDDGFFGDDNGNPTDGNNKGIEVDKNKTYYLYGWWQNGAENSHLQDFTCGVAELLEVTFKPEKSVTPLAKWVDSGTTSDDNLATVTGYDKVSVKKKSDNIATCTASIVKGGHGNPDKLTISNITFVDENKGGGTILLALHKGPNIEDTDPVFAYTIAYNAGYNPQVIGQDNAGNDVSRSEGHTWNFSDNPLKALQWSDKTTEADVVDFGTHFNNFATATKDDNGIPTNGTNNSFLTYEYNKGDWTFNYRVKKNGQFHDPRFLNNWDMEGDNADMMWDTEGLIIYAGSSQSCIFDEFSLTSNRVIDHTNKTQDDPDRYVGFLEGGSFIIPKLKAGDRVIIYMGSGAGSGSTAMRFKITNALDALHNPISPDDEYYAGGSQWNTIDGHNDPNYRGCYHFYAAADGDMSFKMVGGSMCKLYSIKIYTGEREETNGVQENGNGYTIFATKTQNGNNTTVTTGTNTWNLHYRGKGEVVANGVKGNTVQSNLPIQENEILAHSATITQNLTLDRLSNGSGISYTNQGEIGMLRVRVKCMEYNNNYVTDFSDRNFTLALHETKSYPYTWDFTDLKDSRYTSVTDIATEDESYPETTVTYDTKGYDLSIWDSEGKMVIYGPSWGYTNQNMIFENCKGVNGNQLWANDKIIPETQGLWFYMDNNATDYSGSMQITEDGLVLANKPDQAGNRRGWWNYKTVIPSVPAGAAVYLRVARVSEIEDNTKDGQGNYFFHKTFRFDSHMPYYPTYNSEKRRWELKYVKYEIGGTPREDNETNATWDACKVDNVNYEAGSYQYNSQYEQYSKFYPAEDNSGDYIMAIYNWGAESNLILTLNGFVLKKMSVSTDPKQIGKTGYATESRGRAIDHELTSYLTGKPIKAYTASFATDDKSNVDYSTVVLSQFGGTESSAKILPTSTDGAMGGCILYHDGGTATTDGHTDRTVSILDGGFHEFVPDMHDKDVTSKVVSTSGNIMKSFLPITGAMSSTEKFYVGAIDGSNTNLILSAKKYSYGTNGTNVANTGYDVFFVRVDPDGNDGHGATLKQNSAYIQIPTTKMIPLSGSGSSGGNGGNLAKVSIVFADDFFTPNPGITTSIDDASHLNDNGKMINDKDAEWYNLNGQKLNGKPTSSGLYIVNGKKVLVK